MENKSNAVTKEGERFDSRATTEQFRKGGVANVQSSVKQFANRVPATNDATYDAEPANDEHFDETQEARNPHKPSNVRFIARTSTRGVAGDVKRRTTENRSRSSKTKLTGLSGTTTSGAGVTGVATKFIPPQAKAALAVAKNAKKLKGVLGWGLIAPVATAYLFQLTFAIVSLIGFGIYSAIQTAIAESKVLGVVVKVVSWFTDIETFIPGNNIGYIFWMLALLTSLGVFIACTIIFYIKGGNPFDSAVSFLVAALCLAGSMLPVLNLLPLMLLWVIYVNTRSTASLFST